MTKLILFLFRVKYKLKKNEKFQFFNQKNSLDYYYISDDSLNKIGYRKCKELNGKLIPRQIKANVSLNWLLDPECKIVKIK